MNIFSCLAQSELAIGLYVFCLATVTFLHVFGEARTLQGRYAIRKFACT